MGLLSQLTHLQFSTWRRHLERQSCDVESSGPQAGGHEGGNIIVRALCGAPCEGAPWCGETFPCLWFPGVWI